MAFIPGPFGPMPAPPTTPTTSLTPESISSVPLNTLLGTYNFTSGLSPFYIATPGYIQVGLNQGQCQFQISEDNNPGSGCATIPFVYLDDNNNLKIANPNWMNLQYVPGNPYCIVTIGNDDGSCVPSNQTIYYFPNQTLNSYPVPINSTNPGSITLPNNSIVNYTRYPASTLLSNTTTYYLEFTENSNNITQFLLAVPNTQNKTIQFYNMFNGNQTSNGSQESIVIEPSTFGPNTDNYYILYPQS